MKEHKALSKLKHEFLVNTLKFQVGCYQILTQSPTQLCTYKELEHNMMAMLTKDDYPSAQEYKNQITDNYRHFEDIEGYLMETDDIVQTLEFITEDPYQL